MDAYYSELPSSTPTSRASDATSPARESERATTIKSLLLLRLVSSFNSDHRPEDLEQTEADEQQRAARERELREGARLALRPARG